MKYILDKGRKILKHAMINALTGAIIFGSAGAFMQHRFESNRDKLIPISFSEISQIKDDAAIREKEVPSYTLYYAGLWDTINKINEAWNMAWKYNINEEEAYKEFAESLEGKMHESKHRHNLEFFLSAVPSDAKKSLEDLSEFRKARNRLEEVQGHFSRTWKHDYNDNTHLESYPCFCDKDGCSTCWRSVYDNTDHKYTYFDLEGETASKKLDRLLVDFSDLFKIIDMKTGKKVQKENLDVIKDSRKIDSPEKEISAGEYLTLATNWKYNSKLHIHSVTFADPWKIISGDAKKWREAKKTAKTEEYTNTHRGNSDPGPIEFQVVNTTMNHNREFMKHVDDVFNGMEISRRDLPKLKRLISDYIEDASAAERYPDRKVKRPKDAVREIRELVSSISRANFNGEFGTGRYRNYMVPLIGLLGSLIGAGLGYGVYRVADAIGLSVKEEWQRKENAFL